MVHRRGRRFSEIYSGVTGSSPTATSGADGRDAGGCRGLEGVRRGACSASGQAGGVAAVSGLDSFFGPEVVAALERLVSERVAAELAEQRPRFLSRAALAVRYGVGERTVRTWRERGLPGVRVGREVMYPVDECDRWIERHG